MKRRHKYRPHFPFLSPLSLSSSRFFSALLCSSRCSANLLYSVRRIRYAEISSETMRYHRNAVGSLALDGSAGGSFRLWPAFSTAAFRRKLIDTMSCGASRHHQEKEPPSPSKSPKQPQQAQKRTDSCSKRNAGGSERLHELLSLEARESGVDEASEEEMRRKMALFEEMRGVVKKLQGAEQKKEAAMEVRRLAKEDAEARVTLAMLGAIPPLVGMLDSEDAEFQIAALYGLLNLGIGNDM